MKNKKKLLKHIGIAFIISLFISFIIIEAIIFQKKHEKVPVSTKEASINSINTKIVASGSIRSLNEATLHFQTGGKLTYLPFKEGDSVNQGQTIASIDSYAIQKQLEIALNNYKSARNAFDQTVENSSNNVLQGQQKAIVDTSKAGVGGALETDVINSAVKRIVDTNQANLNNSVIQVQLSNYAFSLASITSPINGIIIHEDVKTPFVNITPLTSFTVIDPTQFVFRANIAEDEVTYVYEGSHAEITLNGQSKPIDGTVIKIYPEKIALPNGEYSYQVDIASDLLGGSKYNQDGTVSIDSKYNHPVILVPSWLVISKEYIWVYSSNKPSLKKVEIGQTLSGKTEILSGIEEKDKIIMNPQNVIQDRYLIK
jgi:multidrug efflux pump subunit AcrA (membrane-fusion protein)